MQDNSNTVDRANKIIEALLNHLDKENCKCCHDILNEVFES